MGLISNDLAGSVEDADRKYHLHSYTNARLHEQCGPLTIERGEGIYVYDTQGRRYIEGMAGLWSVALGFSEQRLVDAAQAQMATLPFYHTFGHKTNRPAALLAEKLISCAPAKMAKVFFSNSGSEANDTAIKMVRYFNSAHGRPQKRKIVSRKGAYHGVTMVAASLTGLPNNHTGFELPLNDYLHLTCPHFRREGLEGESEAAFCERLAGEFEALILQEGPETIAAFIGEPLMAAGGVIVPPEGYWAKVQAICKKYDILVIADEVVCGFGRTGVMFGSDLFGIEPDIMVVSKQLTSSYFPLGAVLISEEIADAIADMSAKIGTFGHGFTTSGHPVAAAVALENIRLIEERGLVDNAARMGARLHAGLARLAEHPLVREVRGVGFIAAVELEAPAQSEGPSPRKGELGATVFRLCQDNGLITRCIGDSIALCPPLIASEAEVDTIVSILSGAVYQA